MLVPVSSSQAATSAGLGTAPSFEQLLEAAPDAIVGVEDEGKIVFVNGQTETLFECSRGDLIGEEVRGPSLPCAATARLLHRARRRGARGAGQTQLTSCSDLVDR